MALNPPLTSIATRDQTTEMTISWFEIYSLYINLIRKLVN